MSLSTLLVPCVKTQLGPLRLLLLLLCVVDSRRLRIFFPRLLLFSLSAHRGPFRRKSKTTGKLVEWRRARPYGPHIAHRKFLSVELHRTLSSECRSRSTLSLYPRTSPFTRLPGARFLEKCWSFRPLPSLLSFHPQSTIPSIGAFQPFRFIVFL